MFLYSYRARFFTGCADAGSSLWLILYCKELSGLFVWTEIVFTPISLLASWEVEGSRLSAAAKEISMD